MKKWIALLLALVMCLSLCACGSSTSNDTAGSANAEKDESATEAPEKAAAQPIQIGETVKTDNFEFTLDDVQVGGSNEENMLTSRGGSGRYRTDGQAIVLVDVTIKNLSKEEVKANRMFEFKVDYNDGYTYELDSITGLDISPEGKYLTEPAIHAEEVSPLSAVWYEGTIDVPEEVYTNQDAPLLLNLKLWDGSEFTYQVTADNYIQ